MKVRLADDGAFAPAIDFVLTPKLVLTRPDGFFVGYFDDIEQVKATWPDREVTITEE